MNVRWRSLALAFVAVALSPSAAAVDGLILIDQNKAMAGNVTPGDAAGFPVTISRSGSYRLTSDLILPNADATGIDVAATAGDVTIDLNGFAILGPVVCSGSSAANPTTSCTPKPADTSIFGPGTGIRSLTDSSIVVRNGTIRGVGRHGVFVASGAQARIEGLMVKANGGYGIFGGLGTISDNIVEANLQDGIVFNQGMVRNNNVRRNGGHAISSTGIGGIITGNNLYRNGGAALSNLANSPYSFNNLDNNFGGFVTPTGAGNNVGHNSCNGGACP